MVASTKTTAPAVSVPAPPLPSAAMLVHGAILDMLARNKAEVDGFGPLATPHGESHEHQPQGAHHRASD